MAIDKNKIICYARFYLRRIGGDKVSESRLKELKERSGKPIVIALGVLLAVAVVWQVTGVQGNPITNIFQGKPLTSLAGNQIYLVVANPVQTIDDTEHVYLFLEPLDTDDRRWYEVSADKVSWGVSAGMKITLLSDGRIYEVLTSGSTLEPIGP